jgi:cytochrome P450 family 110
MSEIPSLSTPKIFEAFQWIVKPLEYLHERKQACGDVFSGNVSGTLSSAVLFSNPQAIQQILTNDTKQLSAPGSNSRVLEPILGGRGMTLLDGNEHHQRRQLVMPQFHGDKIKVYIDTIQEIAKEVIQGWQIGETLNVKKEMEKITLSVILRTVFGLNRGDRYDLIRDKLFQMLLFLESPLNSVFLFVPWLQKDLGAWSSWGRFIRDRAELDMLMYAEITECRQNAEIGRTDILSMLIGSQDADGNGMSDLELHDELMTLLFAGHETTATALAWAIYWINYLPEVKEKLLTEIATLGTEPDAMAISKLPYLNAVCSETLRIYPVAITTMPRVVDEPISIGGYDLKPNTVVMGCIYLTHHREDLYPEAHLFKPERFLDSKFSPYEYLPFGGGVRRCIGVALAQLELKLVLFEILTKCELTLIDKLPIIPVQRGIVLGPESGVNVRLDRKK